MDQQKSYIYRQSKDRAAKRQRTEPVGVDMSFELRKRAYRAAWAQQEDQFDSLVKALHDPVLQDITQDICNTVENATLPAALIVTGSSGASNDVLFEQLRATVLAENTASCFVSLTASDAPNLKTLLKNLIRKATNETTGFDDEGDAQPEVASQRRLLNYDLQILHDWIKSRPQNSVIISFQDSEAFDAGILTDTLALLKSWLDRISFKLVFGIATSLDLFQDRLPKTALRNESVTAEKSTVRLGPTLVADFMQRQHDHMQSVHDFKQALKYAYMSHFYADPLSVFLCEGLSREEISPEHFEVVRHVPSFRKHIEALLKANDVATARDLLDSDDALLAAINAQIIAGRRQTVWTMGACSVIKAIRSAIPNREAVPFSALYTRTLSGTLQSSALMRETLLYARKADSTALIDLLTKVADTLIVMPPSSIDVSPDDFSDLQEELEALLDSHSGPLPLQSGSADGSSSQPNSTRVATSKKKQPAQSEAQVKYNSILSRFHDLLADYFTKALCPLSAVFLSEVLFYDLKSPHRDVFTPKPRVAVERALSAPHDYLGCQCCSTKEGGLSSTQPATAILYQLYLESGALINAFDLWSAFRAMIGEREKDERSAMALFFQSLAELKYLGMEHVALTDDNVSEGVVGSGVDDFEQHGAFVLVEPFGRLVDVVICAGIRTTDNLWPESACCSKGDRERLRCTMTVTSSS
ncbi:hypothetical protein FH972_025571 [Carpinus fangiana]|uniref:Uncharacterized protein n=1 Tax=Carpinus fangiana TaxID=176857 RepID=A0A5N6L1D7_9ROSI|nr:hypothetical protein FH972_025571 [Carpinus fangiana]